MKISIAMTTYNGEKYISEQLESFIAQTRQPDELVITDDCSTDKTMDILREFKKKSPFDVKIYSNKLNLGYTQNFNKSLQLCSGDIVFLSDQDDVWFSNKIEYMVRLSKRFPNKMVFMCDTEFTDAKLKPMNITKQFQIKSLGSNMSRFVTGCCIVVKRNFLNQILPIPKEFKGHDNWIVYIADKLNLRYVDSEVCQYYRRHGENESMAMSNKLGNISLCDRMNLLYVRIIRKFFIKNWIEYFQKRKLINTKVKELTNSKKLFNEN